MILHAILIILFFGVLYLATSPAHAQSPSVILTWTDTNTTEDGYAIERRLESGLPWTEITRTKPNATTFTDTTIAANTRYCYRVRAYAATSYSAYSSPDACTLIAATDVKVTVTVTIP